MSHSRRTLCRVSMCSRVIKWVGREWGDMLPRSKCNVVDIANVPQD
jgi:hypothetical protein